MSDLYNLSKKLKVRAEVLRKKLEEETGQPVSLGDTIPEDHVEFLEKSFERPSATQRWLKQVGEKFQSPQPSEEPPTPTPTGEVVEAEEKTAEEDVDADLIAELMGDSPSIGAEPDEDIQSVDEEVPALEADPIKEEEAADIGRDDESDLLESAEAVADELASVETESVYAEDVEEAIEDLEEKPETPSELEEIPELLEKSEEDLDLTTEDLTGLLQDISPEPPEDPSISSEEESPFDEMETGLSEDPEEGLSGEEEMSLGIFTELEQIGELRESIPDESDVYDFMDVESEIEAEIDTEDDDDEDSPKERSIAESILDQPQTEFDDEEDEPVSSEQLQEIVDNLFGDLPPEEEDAEGRPSSMMGKTVGPAVEFWEELEPKEKLLLKAGATLSILMIAGGIYWNSLQQRQGADVRLYQSGIRSQQEGDFESAEVDFKNLIRRYPESLLTSEASFRIAEILREEEDHINSSRTMNQGLEFLSEDVAEVTGEWDRSSREKLWKGFHFLGEVHALRQDWDNASDKFTEVIENATGHPVWERSLYQHADVLYEMGRPDEAETSLLRRTIRAYDRALDASAETTRILPAYLRLSETWERLADREKGQKEPNLERSLEFLDKLRAFGKGSVLAGLSPKEVDLEIARLLRELGRTQESIDLLRKVISAPRDEFLEGPLPHRYNLALGRSLIQRAEELALDGRAASAEVDLYEVLEIARPDEQNPFEGDDETEATYLRGHSYYNLGVLLSKKNGDPRNTHFTKMLAAYQSALERSDSYGKSKNDSLLALLRRTNYLYDNAEQYNDAVREYSRILADFPENPYAYRVQYKLGDALYRLERYREAEGHFREAVREFPRTRYTDDDSFRGSYFGLATCQYLQKDYPRAVRTYETLLSLVQYEDSPEALLAWKRLADAYHQQGLIDESIDELRGYLKKYPNRDENGLVRFQLARNLFERFDYEEGREELRRIVSGMPKESETVRWSHYLLCKSYQDESALAVGNEREELLNRVLDEAEKIRIAYPDEDRPLSIMGLTYFDLGDYERAAKYLEYYNQASRTETPDADNQLKLAESFFRLRRYPEAISAYKKVDVDEFSIGGRDEAALTLFNLAESLRYENRLTEAVVNYEKILEDYPTSTLRELAEGRINELQWRISKGISIQGNP